MAVPLSECSRASAMMALVYKVAHFVGLGASALVAWLMYRNT